MKWTEGQLSAIETRDKNILVAAAAGSGKTAVLVERIKRMILKERVPVDRLLIVTFTNKAAAEMKEKIVESLSREIEANPSESQFLREQLNSIYRANICTFHAFALTIIRRYFYVIGVDPDLKIADEAEGRIMKGEAADRVFEARFALEDEGFISFLNSCAKGRSLDGAKELLIDAHNRLMSVPEPEKWLSQYTEILLANEENFEESALYGNLKEELGVRLETAAKGYENTVKLLRDHGLEILAGKVFTEEEYCRKLIKILEEEKFMEFAAAISEFPKVRLIASKEEKLSYGDIQERVKLIRSSASKCINDIKKDYFSYDFKEYLRELRDTYDVTKTFSGLIEEFGRLYAEEKQEKHLMDFNDIEHFALRILDDERVAEEYREKIDYIYIDEYQDSNLIQEALIGKIKRDNNVFMVGDVKQSIYKFRLAEPEILMEKYRRYRDGKEKESVKVDLNINFRSKAEIINTVNQIFEQSMEDYDEDAALHLGITGGEGYKSELHLVYRDEENPGSEEIAEMKTAEREALIASRIIKDSIGEPIFDVKKGIMRPIEKRDIVILMRGIKNTGSVFRKVLTDMDVPCHVEEDDGYFDTIEIEVFLNLLKIIDNGKQDTPLLSVLYSPIFGLDSEELSEIRLYDLKLPYHKAFSEYGEQGQNERLREKARNIGEKLNSFRIMTASYPLSDFIWELMWDTGFYTYVGGLPAGLQRQANLRALADRAGAFSKDRPGSIYDFLNYIENIKQKKVPTGQTRLLSEKDDLVRIMTIHKSKGLEYPVVILAGMGRRFNYRGEGNIVSIHKDVGIGINLVDRENHWRKKTLIQKLIQNRMERESAEEELRILYVGCTRAMDKLIMIGSTAKTGEQLEQYEYMNPKNILSASSYLDVIIPSIKGKAEIKLWNAESLSGIGSAFEEQREDIKTTIVSSISDGEIQKDEINRRLSYEYPYKAQLKMKSKYSVTELTQSEEDEIFKEKEASFAVPLFMAGERTFTSGERGTLYHSVMEHMDFQAAQDYIAEKGEHGAVIYVENMIKDMVEREIFLSEEASAVNPQRIAAFLVTDLGKRIAEAQRKGLLYKETPFTLKMKKEEGEIFVQGIIDCYFEEKRSGKSTYVLVDYKSGGGKIEDIKRRYTNQITIYAQALEKIKGIEVGEAYLWLFKENMAVEI